MSEQEDKKMPSAEKLRALQLAMEKIEKDHGKGTIMKLGDNQCEDVNVIPTGSIGLNIALGVGGYPRGRIIEIYGPESSGKTTLAIHAIAEAQKAGEGSKQKQGTSCECTLKDPYITRETGRFPSGTLCFSLRG